MQQLSVVLAIGLTIAAAILCGNIITHSTTNQNLKTDYAELNNIKYGLLSVEAWKKRLVEIVRREIDKFYISRSTEAELLLRASQLR
jgi:poly-beta-hydroxyalkanoate depolymerase